LSQDHGGTVPIWNFPWGLDMNWSVPIRVRESHNSISLTGGGCEILLTWQMCFALGV